MDVVRLNRVRSVALLCRLIVVLKGKVWACGRRGGTRGEQSQHRGNKKIGATRLNDRPHVLYSVDGFSRANPARHPPGTRRPSRKAPIGKSAFCRPFACRPETAASGAIGHAPRLSRASVIRSLDFLVLRKWTCAEDARTSRARAVYWRPREVYSAIYSSQSSES